MESFRTEIENPIVAQDIIDLEKKIFEFKNNSIDEEKFRSLRLARGVYGQRQQGVQMIRIKIPMGKFSAKQLRRIAEVSDTYSNGNLHITTRQDVQIHYVDLDKTPQLWAELEKDNITLREACGNTVRNVTASPFAGIDKDEPFDVTPYANAFFQYFLRNPICQDLGRKIKVAFSSSTKDLAYTFVHDLGFIPKIKEGKHGFKVVVGGGIGSQPRAAESMYDFLEADKIIPVSEAILRLFDRFGERNRRNKARLKFLVKDLGFEVFKTKVDEMFNEVTYSSLPINYKEEQIKNTLDFTPSTAINQSEFERWKKVNTFQQKQDDLVAVGLCIQTGDISSSVSRSLADIIESFCGEESRFTINQGILLRSIKKSNLEALYEALDKIQLTRVGYNRINDIVACPGTDTCNLGIASSIGLAKELERIIESEFTHVIDKHNITIKISGCINACGQHTLADIGFQGMTMKANGKIAPATQVLLGGGNISNGEGTFADKVLKVPSKRTPTVLRWILNDFEKNQNKETFYIYYKRKGADYFYQNLKHLSNTETIEPSDFIDWGNDAQYEKAIGVGECAGVTIDLVQTLLFDAEEALKNALIAITDKKIANSIYYSYSAQIRAAKALLTRTKAKINSHSSIIISFDENFSDFKKQHAYSFADSVNQIKESEQNLEFARTYYNNAKTVLNWIKKKTNDQ